MYNYLTDLGRNLSDAWLFGALITLGFFAIIISIGAYIYIALAWYAIAKKMKHQRPWLAWIPIANIALWFQMGRFHWAWIFLILVPLVGWLALFVIFILSTWRVFEDLDYPGWLSLSPILDSVAAGIGTIIYAVTIGIVAWRKDGKKSSRKRR